MYIPMIDSYAMQPVMYYDEFHSSLKISPMLEAPFIAA